MKKKFEEVKERPKSILDRLVSHQLDKNIYINKSKVIIVEIFKSSLMKVKMHQFSHEEKSEDEFNINNDIQYIRRHYLQRDKLFISWYL
jgi:hypothetical protein